MRRRLSLVVVTTFLACLEIACGRGSSPHPTPTAPTVLADAPATAVATARPKATDPLGATKDAIAVSPILQARGWLVYLRGNDLYAGDLLTGNEVPLTAGSMGAGYAGTVPVGDERWIYYTSIIAETRGTGTLAGTFAVYRRPLGAGSVDEEKLFEFTASDRYLFDFWTNASVSSDGRDIAYTDDAGLHLFDVESHDDRRLLSNQPSSDRNTPGNRYSSPAWSPAGGWLAVTRSGTRRPYDSQFSIETIGPLEGTEYTLGGGRGFRQWSPDGSRLCGDTYTTAAAGIGLLTPGSAETIDLTPNLFDNAILRPRVDSCAWAEDGRLAVGYEADGLSHFTIAIIDASGMPIARIDAGAVLPGVDQWLPDRTGFVVATLSDRLSFNSAAVMMDGTYRRLPFAAERVLGTISIPYRDN